MTDSIFHDAELTAAEKRHKSVVRRKKMVEFIRWLLPLLLFTGAVYAYASTNTTSAVIGIAIACLWLGINIDKYFMEG